jgi:hypothetical protein
MTKTFKENLISYTEFYLKKHWDSDLNVNPEDGDIVVLWMEGLGYGSDMYYYAAHDYFKNEFSYIEGLDWGGVNKITINLTQTTDAAFEELESGYRDVWPCSKENRHDGIYYWACELPEYDKRYQKAREEALNDWWKYQLPDAYKDLPSAYFYDGENSRWWCYLEDHEESNAIYYDESRNFTLENFMLQVVADALNEQTFEIDYNADDGFENLARCRISGLWGDARDMVDGAFPDELYARKTDLLWTDDEIEAMYVASREEPLLSGRLWVTKHLYPTRRWDEKDFVYVYRVSNGDRFILLEKQGDVFVWRRF